MSSNRKPRLEVTVLPGQSHDDARAFAEQLCREYGRNPDDYDIDVRSLDERIAQLQAEREQMQAACKDDWCDECGAQIADDTSMVSTSHRESCSLFGPTLT